MYELKKLNPRIVDCAINLIKDGKQHYTCRALAVAATAIHKKGYGPVYQYKELHRQVHKIEILKCANGRSTWWNSGRPCLASRIRALENTKAYIIATNTRIYQ